MSVNLDYAQISRQANANRARAIETSDDSPAKGAESSKRRVKFSRSTTGCLGCRKQKVKCDETRPTCLRCVAAQRPCEYPTSKEAGGNNKDKKKKRAAEDDSAGSENGSNAPLPVLSALPSDLLRDPPSNSSDSQMDISALLNLPPDPAPPSYDYPPESSGLSSLFEQSPPEPFDIFNVLTPFAFHPPSVSPEAAAVTSPNATAPTPGANSQRPSKRPKLEDLPKSRLLARRAGKANHLPPTPQPAPVPSIAPRIALVDSMLHAAQTDVTLFEFSPSKRISDVASSTLNTVDLLSNAFASATARMLFNHYCNVTSKYLVTMGNIGPNPLLALCTPLNLLDTMTASSAAIRMSILSISTAHFAHETAEAIGSAAHTPEWHKQKEQLDAMSTRFKKAALSNITLAGIPGDSSVHNIDCILAACTLLCIRDVICADPTWQENLEFALSLISKRGGPPIMLKGAEYSFNRRYMLENLAFHDVVGCFITGKEPALLGNYDTWWFDSVETSQTRWEWESVERSFGISRAMVDLVARLAKLDSSKRRLGVSLHNTPKELQDVAQHFTREAHCLLLELDIWGNSLTMLPQNVRVTCGDYIYKYMATIFLLADTLEQPTDTPRIVKCVDYVLELCSEAAAMRMAVMLMWPLMIAGVFCLPATREKVSTLMDSLASDYCEDLVAAREILEEQWRCIDAGQGKQPWMSVMRKIDRFVLII